MVSVHSVRKMGYQVRVFHNRYYLHNGDVDCRGGVTKVEIHDSAHPYCGCVGVSLCSDKDNYNKKLGVRIALGRAMKMMGIPRKNRRVVSSL